LPALARACRAARTLVRSSLGREIFQPGRADVAHVLAVAEYVEINAGIELEGVGADHLGAGGQVLLV